MHNDPLLRKLLSFSPVDDFFAFQAAESVLITGSSGAGKTTTALAQFALEYMRAGYGGVFFTVKADDADFYKRLVKLAGRPDPTVFSADSGAFDPIYYLYHRPGRSTELLETVVSIFSTLIAIGNPHQGNGGNEAFWDLKREQHMRPPIVLLTLAGERVSVKSIDDVISSYPMVPGEHETPEWQAGYCGQLLQKIKERRDSLTERQFNDLSRALHYVCIEWPGLDNRIQSSVTATWTGLADRLLYEPILTSFSSGKCTWIPEDVTQGNQIVIVDFPALAGETNRLASCFVKLAIQHALVNRDIRKHPNPAFVLSDEYQTLVLPRGKEEVFNQVCRSARACGLYATQNLQQLAAQFGETSIGPKLRGWLDTIGTRVSMQQNDWQSAQEIADTIGKIYKPIEGTSVGSQHASVSAQMQLTHRVLPSTFTTLKKASPADPTAEAVIFSGGRIFSASNEPYLITQFSREL